MQSVTLWRDEAPSQEDRLQRKAADEICKQVRTFLESASNRRLFGVVSVTVDSRKEFFLVVMRSEREVFCDEQRAVLRKFFTEDFRSSIDPYLKEKLGWNAIRTSTTPADRCRTSCEWMVTLREPSAA